MNGTRGYWDTEGCRVTGYSADGGMIECSCDHFTNFALLVSPGGQVGTTHVELSIISYIGATFSLVGMVFTIVAHGYIK